MLPARFEDIVESHIQQLITDRVSERRSLEYKRELPTRQDESVREFLADVSSFANAAGGDLVYGIEDERDEGGQQASDRICSDG
jgi:predicted HTH transcriptional regulator